MKGIVLAGGTGSRLRPITHTGPKQLVPIANKPVLQYAIEDLIQAEIDEIGIILGNKGRKDIQQFLGDGSDFGVSFTYIVQGEPLGLAHAVGCARDFVEDEPFVVYLGDDLIREGISDLVNDFDVKKYAAGIGLQEVDDPSRYGIVDINAEGDVIELIEKPADPPNNLALIGIYVFTPAIFSEIEKLEKSWRGEYEITEAIQGLLNSGKLIQSHVVHGWWKDTGKPEDVLHANRLVLDDIASDIQGNVEKNTEIQGRVQLGQGSIIKTGAVIRGPVSIGANTTISGGTYIGPFTSIGSNCIIEGAQIESSIIVGDSKISCDRKIVDSLIGRKASVRTANDKIPEGNRLVIGRNSTVEL